ncbi:MAG TPA: hypothetical protein VGQ33_18800 [Vicinamibacteria bacterium]|nr:hypothetical protein [Vicinamibacteria bacterium]
MKGNPLFGRGARKVILGEVRPVVGRVAVSVDQRDLALEAEVA